MDERLTFEGNFCEIARCREMRWGKHCPDGACSQRKVWERLKEYEDAADVVPVAHGRWEVSIDEWFETDIYTCSKCRESYVLVEGTPKENLWHYCPNCGARMDGAE